MKKMNIESQRATNGGGYQCGYCNAGYYAALWLCKLHLKTVHGGKPMKWNIV